MMPDVTVVAYSGHCHGYRHRDSAPSERRDSNRQYDPRVWSKVFMRKLFALLALVAAGAYGSGYLLLNENGVTALLQQMEALSAQGDADGVCALFDDNLVVALDDRTPESPMQLHGGKAELCAYLSQVLPLQQKFVASTHINRDHFAMAREWQHPWTVHASYQERRVDTMKKLDVPMPSQSAMRSQDQLTVIMTLQGRRISRLTSISEALHGPQI